MDSAAKHSGGSRGKSGHSPQSRHGLGESGSASGEAIPTQCNASEALHCVGIFSDHSITPTHIGLLQYCLVCQGKNLWKSVNIWRSWVIIKLRNLLLKSGPLAVYMYQDFTNSFLKYFPHFSRAKLFTASKYSLIAGFSHQDLTSNFGI